MLAGYTLNNEKLPQVEKNRIDFNQKSNYGVADIAVSQLCQTEASNDLFQCLNNNKKKSISKHVRD